MPHLRRMDHSQEIRPRHLSAVELARHQAMLDQGTSKLSRTFRLLRTNKSKWVTIATIGKVARSRTVGKLIYELRKRGCIIENKTEIATEHSWGRQREMHSSYRLIKEPTENTPTDEPNTPLRN